MSWIRCQITWLMWRRGSTKPAIYLGRGLANAAEPQGVTMFEGLLGLLLALVFVPGLWAGLMGIANGLFGTGGIAG